MQILREKIRQDNALSDTETRMLIDRAGYILLQKQSPGHMKK